MSTFRQAARGRISGSLADEFGDDPMDLVFRTAHSQTTTAGSGSGEGESGRGNAVVTAFLGQMRRGLEREDDHDHDADAETRVSGESMLDEKKERGSTASEAGGSQGDRVSEEVTEMDQGPGPRLRASTEHVATSGSSGHKSVAEAT